MGNESDSIEKRLIKEAARFEIQRLGLDERAALLHLTSQVILSRASGELDELTGGFISLNALTSGDDDLKKLYLSLKSKSLVTLRGTKHKRIGLAHPDVEEIAKEMLLDGNNNLDTEI